MNETQGRLFDEAEPPSRLRFNGPAYSAERDQVRLSGQCLRIYDYMKDGIPRTLKAIEGVTGFPPASISAQLRHLRKPRFGAHDVERQHIGHGLYTYRLIVNKTAAIEAAREGS